MLLKAFVEADVLSICLRKGTIMLDLTENSGKYR